MTKEQLKGKGHLFWCNMKEDHFTMVGKAWQQALRRQGDRRGGHPVTLHQDKKSEEEKVQSLQSPGLPLADPVRLHHLKVSKQQQDDDSWEPRVQAYVEAMSHSNHKSG